MTTANQKSWRPILTPTEKQIFRELTQEELAIAREAILWLHRRHIDAYQIKNLSFNSIDEKRKIVQFKKEGKRIVFVRKIRFSGTPLEKQIENAVETQKSSLFVFSRAGRRGKVRAFTPSLRNTDIDYIVGGNNFTQKSIWTKLNQKSIITINW